MKHASFFACFAAAFAALSALAAPPTKPVIDDQTWEGDCDALATPPLAVSVDNATVVYADWWEDDDTAGKVRVYLQNTGESQWETTLPANHAGHAWLTIVAENADGKSEPTTADYIITENTTDPNGLNSYRYPNLFDWNNLTSGTTPDWIAVNCEHLSSVPQMVRIKGTANPSAIPMSDRGVFQGGVFYSRKIAGGVGSIFFKAKMAGKRYSDGELKLLKVTTKGANARKRYYYTELATLTVPKATGVAEWHQYHIIVQDEADIHDPAKCEDQMAHYAIYNNSLDSPVDVCDIVLTPILPDVVVTKDEADYAPGYPSLQDPIEFHIQVSNRWALAPAANFTPMLVWRQQSDDPWTYTEMTNRADRTDTGDGVYACALDKNTIRFDGTQGLEAGPFEYFYKVNFTGYTPTFPSIRYNGDGLNNVVNGRFGWGRYPYLIHTNDLALLTDADGNLNERRSPAYKPDFHDRYEGLQYSKSLDVAPGTPAEDGVWDFTSRFDLEYLNEGWPHAPAVYQALYGTTVDFEPGQIEIPLTFTYLTFLAEDGIRRFRSMYTHVTAVPRPWDAANPGFDIDAGAVPGLDDCYAMQLVGDYTWQAIIHQTNAIDAAFAVTGAWHSAAGSTEYGHGGTNGAAGSPFFWLEPDQEPTAINPPSADFVELFGSEAVPHEGTQTYYDETLVTNATTTEVDLLETIRPAGVEADIPVGWATVTGGGNEEWHTISPAWMRAEATVTNGVLVEGVTGDGGIHWFYTQWAGVELVGYDSDDNEIYRTNAWSSGAWEPQIVDDGEGNVTTNWWPAEMPDTWAKANWSAETAPGDLFPTYRVSSLDTNGWDFANLIWATNENAAFTEVSFSDAAPWAQIVADDTALAVSPHSTNGNDATFVVNVTLDVERQERTRPYTYYTYRPVPGAYSMPELGTRVQIDYDGFLMYRFCTTNGEYQVRRAAWQDFNDWAADINWFSRSFGLYDMKTFECDLEGRDLTTFDTMPVLGFERLAADHTAFFEGPEYWDGFLAENAWVVDDRGMRAGTKDLQNFNKAVRLSPFSRVRGSLETTSATRVDGRGTWTMKVRPSADDRISVVYDADNSSTWTDYFLAVQIKPTALSDAQGAYASVIFRYEDSENYAEARLVQKGETRSLNNKNQLCQWLELEVWQTVNGVATLLPPWNKAHNNKGDWNDFAEIKGGRNNDKQYWRWPKKQDNNNEPKTTYLLTQGWTVGIALEGNTAEVYVWDNKMTSSSDQKPLQKPAYYDLATVSNPNHPELEKGKKGTFGFDVYDVAATFHPWAYPLTAKPEQKANKNYGGDYPYRATDNNFTFQLAKSTNGADEFNNVANTTPVDNGNYRQNTDRMADNVKPWTIWKTPTGSPTAATGGEAPGIGRGEPTAYYRILTYRSGEEVCTDWSAPVPTQNEDWHETWDDVNGHLSDQVKKAVGYAWQPVDIPMSLWDDTYVMIQALSYDAEGPADKNVNLGAPVIDEFQCDAWCGQTIYDPLITGNNATNRMAVESWCGTYAAIVADGRTGRKWELARSRANPDEAQAVTTPLLEHGIGDIIFKYQVKYAPVSFVVEMLDEDDGSITEIGHLTAQPSATTASFYAPGLKTTTGRIRVRTLGPGETMADGAETAEGDVQGVLYVDELIAHDYPNDAGTSWEAYNMLISSFITKDEESSHGIDHSTLACQKDLKFDGRSKQFDSMRSAVFNDGPGPNKETLQNLPLPEHKPFLQTPVIATGIGELSFWYRAAPGNTEPAKLRFFVANAGTTPDDMWVELTTEDLNYLADRHEAEILSMQSITNIPPDQPWTYFSAEFFQGDYRMLRIYTETNDSCRVMIDNVLITEPVRASIDVGSVEFLPGVPVCTTNTGAKVKLVNPRKNPTDIQVFIDWFATNAPAVPVPITTRSIEYEELREPHEVPVTVDGVKYVATYFITKTVAYTNDLTSTTLLPEAFTTNAVASSWGYTNWPARTGTLEDLNGHKYVVRGSGSIELVTNATDGPYTFYSTNTIPTKDLLTEDAVVQYCVRVLYKGDFGTPILSETQGRTRNGFWFENPSWYEPIDLNLYQGTTDRPVAHFWNFTVGTNQAFVNEVLPIRYKSSGWSWMATVSDEIEPSGIEEQFIELTGLNGGKLGNWTIEHAGKNDKGSLSPWAMPAWTNRLKKAAAFHDPTPLATTNKGWGVYLVGGSSLEDPAADEPLFTDEMNEALAEETDTSKYGNYAYLQAPYGLTLKRGMGAYADRICWGGENSEKDVEDLVAAGFRYIGFRTHGTLGSAQSLAWRGSQSSKAEQDWNTQSALTTGGFNPDQEDRLWPLTYEEDLPEPPLIAQPVIRDFGWTNGIATVTFDVWVTNGVELASEDYVWRCMFSSDLVPVSSVNLIEVNVQPFDGVTAPADGTTNTVVVTVDIGEGPTAPSANFFRLIATPTAEY